jgi:hypothetical protein
MSELRGACPETQELCFLVSHSLAYDRATRERNGGRRELISLKQSPTISKREGKKRIARSILREEIGAACFNAHAHASPLGARSFASRATERHTGGAETKTSDSIGPERRHKRRGAPGDTGHLVACPLAGGASSWLGAWLGDGASSGRKSMSWIVPTASGLNLASGKKKKSKPRWIPGYKKVGAIRHQHLRPSTTRTTPVDSSRSRQCHSPIVGAVTCRFLRAAIAVTVRGFLLWAQAEPKPVKKDGTTSLRRQAVMGGALQRR